MQQEDSLSEHNFTKVQHKLRYGNARSLSVWALSPQVAGYISENCAMRCTNAQHTNCAKVYILDWVYNVESQFIKNFSDGIYCVRYAVLSVAQWYLWRGTLKLWHALIMCCVKYVMLNVQQWYLWRGTLRVFTSVGCLAPAHASLHCNALIVRQLTKEDQDRSVSRSTVAEQE